MRDFYEKRRLPRHSTDKVDTSASLKKDGVSQQTHRFKVGPDGLQELKKKQKGRPKTRALGRKLPSLMDNIAKPALQATPSNHHHAENAADTDTVAPPPFFSNYYFRTGTSDRTEVNGDETPFLSDTQDQFIESLPSLSAPGSFAHDPFNALPLLPGPPRTQQLLYHGM